MPSDAKEIWRRLQYIHQIIGMIDQMNAKLDHNDYTDTIKSLRRAVVAICTQPILTHDRRSRVVRDLMGYISTLESQGNGANDPIIELLWEVLDYLVRSPTTAISLQLPTYTDPKGNPIMASFSLPLDKIATFTITETDTVSGAIVPVDPADVFTAVSGDPTNLAASIGTNAAGGPALVVNWLHTTSPLLTGVVVTISDSMGNTADPQSFDMVQPAAIPEQIGLDVANVVLTSQPIPT